MGARFGPCCVHSPGGNQYFCQIIEEDICLAGGGVWYAEGDCEGTTVLCNHTACCLPDGTCQMVDNTFAHFECDNLGGTLQPTDTQCFTNPCSERFACCLPTNECLLTTETDCTSQRGFWRIGSTCDNTDCSNVDVPTGCRMYNEHPTSPDGLQWSLDLCHPLIFSEVIDKNGYSHPLTTHRARAVEVDLFQAIQPCAYHTGVWVLSLENELQIASCSIPRLGSTRQNQVSFSVLALQHDRINGTVPGYYYDFGVYHAPFWGEAKYHSTRTVCIGIQ